MPERKKLIDGFKVFKNKFYDKSALMKDLVNNGAHPDFFIIHCIDPRSGAGTVFNSKPGDLFGDRVMAALVPPYPEDKNLSASLSFAINHKHTKHIIILGHTQCGGIQALVDGTKDPSIQNWVSTAQSAFKRAKQKIKTNDKKALYEETEKQSVILSLKNLLTYPDVKDAFKAGKITINGWLFDMKHGDLLEYNPTIDEFQSLVKKSKNTQAKPSKKTL